MRRMQVVDNPTPRKCCYLSTALSSGRVDNSIHTGLSSINHLPLFLFSCFFPPRSPCMSEKAQ